MADKSVTLTITVVDGMPVVQLPAAAENDKHAAGSDQIQVHEPVVQPEQVNPPIR